MRRSALLSLAFAGLCAAAPASAAYFEAQPVTPSTQQRFVARDNGWACTAAGCASARTSTRPAMVCSSLARAVGPLGRFSADGRAFTAEELAACNGAAAH